MNTKIKITEKMTLADLKNGQKAIIIKVKGRGAFRKRIMEMGFIKGKEIAVIKNAPLKDPIEYKIMGYNISLRRNEAKLIEVLTHTKQESQTQTFSVNVSNENFKTRATLKSKEINIALVGNPNCGKTTLFNVLCGSKEKVGNYSGVTIDAKESTIQYEGYTFNIVDLPGTYSLTAYTKEEIFVRNHIIDQTPDLIINVLDASNLERNMYLTTQLIDMDLRIVAALNMFDEMEQKGDILNHKNLA
jgi:ferrous iron transport protein B